MYLLIRPNEGDDYTWLDGAELQQLLTGETAQDVTRFLGAVPDVEGAPGREPAYWPDGVALLLEVKVLTPEPVVTQWRLPSG